MAPNAADGISNAAAKYRLNRDVLASSRLNYQHYIWKETLGFLLHPSIDTSKTGIRIADVGTGTAVWLHDLSRTLPKAVLHGFDISNEQYPAQGFIGDISLMRLDIMKDIPAEHVEQYDVVHVRLLVQVVNQAAGGDPHSLIQNLNKFLKPGGYLQWEEPNDDFANREIVKADPALSSHNWESLLHELQKPFHAPKAWTARLAEALEQQGFCNVTRNEFATDNYLLVLDQINSLQFFGELASNADGQRRDELMSLHRKAVDEAKKGIAARVQRFCFLAQKPSLSSKKGRN